MPTKISVNFGARNSGFPRWLCYDKDLSGAALSRGYQFFELETQFEIRQVGIKFASDNRVYSFFLKEK